MAAIMDQEMYCLIRAALMFKSKIMFSAGNYPSFLAFIFFVPLILNVNADNRKTVNMFLYNVGSQAL